MKLLYRDDLSYLDIGAKSSIRSEWKEEVKDDAPTIAGLLEEEVPDSAGFPLEEP